MVLSGPMKPDGGNQTLESKKVFYLGIVSKEKG